MRITLQAKAENRTRILEAARDLFTRKGYDGTTTRDVARTVGIATGTLFNYFPTKEQIVAALASDALAAAHAEASTLAPPPETLEERLFALTARELRHLRPFRTILRPVLDLDCVDPNPATADGDFRQQHASVAEPLLTSELGDEPGPLAMRLYGTLYTGVLIAWTADESPNQEDTLALLDQSLRMFVAWLRAADKRTEAQDTISSLTSPSD